MKAMIVWPCLKVFWFSKDNPTGQSERKKKEADRRRGGKTISNSGQNFASSTRAAENRSRWKGNVANSSVVPRRPSKVMG